MPKPTLRPVSKSTSQTFAAADARRRAVIFVSLVVVLTFTSVLLLALAPQPLQPSGTTIMHAAYDAGR